jgi:hypothetical protein
MELQYSSERVSRWDRESSVSSKRKKIMASEVQNDEGNHSLSPESRRNDESTNYSSSSPA